MRGFGLPLTDMEVILMALRLVISFTKMHLRYIVSYDNYQLHPYKFSPKKGNGMFKLRKDR